MKTKSIIITVSALLCISMTACSNVVETTTSTPAETAAAVSETAAESETTTVEAADTTSAASETTAASTEASSEAAASTKSTTVTAPAMPEDSPNAYSFYAETEIPQTSVSVKQFEGDWISLNSTAESIHFYECEILNGSFSIVETDGNVTWGYVQLEYQKNSDGTKTSFYNLYTNGGKLLSSIGTGTDIPFEHFSSTDGKYDFSRDGSNAEVSADEGFAGVWSCGRITIDVDQNGSSYDVNIKWSSSASECTFWFYTGTLGGDSLVCTGGTCTEVSYAEDGTDTSTVMYTDGTADLVFDGDGNLLWYDHKDNIADGSVFLRG